MISMISFLEAFRPPYLPELSRCRVQTHRCNKTGALLSKFSDWGQDNVEVKGFGQANLNKNLSKQNIVT